MTDVLIADDHPVVLRGFRRLMEEASDVCLHEATDPIGAYRIFHRLRPAVVVTDLTFQGDGLAGLSLIRRVRALEPATRILAFSMHDDPVIVARALESGATGYVLKDTASGDLYHAFERVQAGESYLDPALAAEVALLRAAARPDPLAALTTRERQILALLGAGRSHGAIAEDLAVSYKTVANACSQMRHKLGARSLADLIRIGVRESERAR